MNWNPLLRLLTVAPAAVLLSVAATTALPERSPARAVAPAELSARTPSPERALGTSRHDGRLELAHLTATAARVAENQAPPSEQPDGSLHDGPAPRPRAAVQAPAAVPVQAAVVAPVEAPPVEAPVVPLAAAADLAAVPAPQPELVSAPEPAEPDSAPEPAAEPDPAPAPAAEPEPAPEREPALRPQPAPEPEPAPPVPAAAAVAPEPGPAPVPAPAPGPAPVSEPEPEPAARAVPAPAAPAAPAPVAAAPVPAPVSLPAAAAELLRRVGEERAAVGCPSLTVDPQLTVAAQRHASDMTARQYFSHTGSDGSSASGRAAAAGASPPVGENLAAGQGSAQAVVDDWLASPGHRDNMLDCGWTRTGVAYDGGQVGPDITGVWVQVFG